MALSEKVRSYEKPAKKIPRILFGGHMFQQRLITTLTPELYCSDIRTSVKFYTELLGFKIQYERNEEGFAMLERQSCRIMLDQVRTKTAADECRTWLAGPLERPFGRGINLQMITADVDGLYKRVQASDAKIFLRLEEKWYRANEIELGNRQFIVSDPDGYLLRFFQDLGERRSAVAPTLSR